MLLAFYLAYIIAYLRWYLHLDALVTYIYYNISNKSDEARQMTPNSRDYKIIKLRLCKAYRYYSPITNPFQCNLLLEEICNLDSN